MRITQSDLSALTPARRRLARALGRLAVAEALDAVARGAQNPVGPDGGVVVGAVAHQAAERAGLDAREFGAAEALGLGEVVVGPVGGDEVGCPGHGLSFEPHRAQRFAVHPRQSPEGAVNHRACAVEGDGRQVAREIKADRHWPLAAQAHGDSTRTAGIVVVRAQRTDRSEVIMRKGRSAFDPAAGRNLQVRATGIAWYYRQDYARILDIMIDAADLPRTYDQWRQRAEKLQREIERAGGIAVPAIIDPDTFPDWCRARGLNVDAEGRQAFASDAAYAKARNQS